MKVLYVHQFFNTPEDGGSIRSYYLAKAMVEKGYEVEMLTSHAKKNRLKKTIEGIRVTYLPIQYDNSYGYWGRVKAYVGFSIKACIESLQFRNVAFCYIMTTPLTTGVIALFNKYILRRPYFFEVGDLWPRVPFEMGVIKNSFLKSFLLGFEKVCYRQSIGTIGLSPPISQHITKHAPSTKVETIFNISDCQYFYPSEPPVRLKAKYGIEKEIVITYTGTFGLANDLIRTIELINHLQHLPLKFLFIGMGAEKNKISRRAKELNLSNCLILDFQSKEGMKEILSLSDIMFISFANYPSLFTGSPNKLFDALAAGLMVITNFDGWIKELIEGEECGFSFSHNSPSDFEKKIKLFLDNRTLLQEYKENSRKLAEKRFDLKFQSEKLLGFITNQVS